MILGALGPLLQIKTGLPDDPAISAALTFVGILPLELYFIPRFLLAVDAERGQNPLNPPETWKLHFEERWLRAFWGKILLAMAIAVGVKLLIVPGVLVLVLFGWTPLRILLRGETLVQAAKGSMQLMIHAWYRVLLVASAMLLAYLCCFGLLLTAVEYFVPDPTPHQRLTHPAIWTGNLVGNLLSLWLSTCLLTLYQRVEVEPQVRPSPQ